VLEENENGSFHVAVHMTAHPATLPFLVASVLFLMYSTSSSFLHYREDEGSRSIQNISDKLLINTALYLIRL